jgi:predicted nucleic acid-binding protein
VNIFLDTNVWLEDKHLTSTGFSSLCAYLKRTGSSIVLPNLVLEEVLGVYERKLVEKCEKAFSARRDVLNYLIRQESHNTKFKLRVDSSVEVEAFRKRLLEPSPGIKTVQCDESKIDIREVYGRGIKRKRPANRDGEELRDVILWLTVLEYARNTKSSIALVTRDSGFWDGEKLHSELHSDIAACGVEVFAYKDVDSFNKANALKSSALTAKEVQKLIDVRTLDEKAVEEVRRRLDGVEVTNSIVRFRSGKVLDASFGDGKLYDVAEGVQFAEVSYQTTIFSEITFKDKPKSSDLWYEPLLKSPSGVDLPSLTSLWRLARLAGTPEPEERNSVFKARYTAQVSIRLVKGNVATADLDMFTILDVINDKAVIDLAQLL